MNDPFLTFESVRRLTGYEKPSFQLRWCKLNGVQAWLSSKGECIVPLVAIEGRKAANESSWAPDLDVFRKG